MTPRTPGSLKRRLTALIAPGFGFIFGSFANASEYNIQFGAVDVPGLEPGKSTAILVADTGADGFVGFGDPQAPETQDVALFDPAVGCRVDDDVVVMTLAAADAGGVVTLESIGIVRFETEDAQWDSLLGSEQPLGLYFFPDGTHDAGATVGFYRCDAITDREFGANQPYRTPSAGETVTILSVGASAGGGVNEESFTRHNANMPRSNVFYRDWIAAFFPGMDDIGEVTGKAADPDEDGMSNLQEFHAGNPPDVAGPWPTLSVSLRRATDWGIRMRYQRQRVEGDARSQWQWSLDLVSWHDNGATYEGMRVLLCESVVATAAARVTVEARIQNPTSLSARPVYFRLRVVAR